MNSFTQCVYSTFKVYRLLSKFQCLFCKFSKRDHICIWKQTGNEWKICVIAISLTRFIFNLWNFTRNSYRWNALCNMWWELKLSNVHGKTHISLHRLDVEISLVVGKCHFHESINGCGMNMRNKISRPIQSGCEACGVILSVHDISFIIIL